VTKIPRARELLEQALDQLSVARASIEEALSLMTRITTRKASRKSQRMTPELANRIRVYANNHKAMSYRAIGNVFNVDGGRVSEIVRGLK
jgi:uncharacterized protein Smg (DUF494 family)